VITPETMEPATVNVETNYIIARR